MYMKHFCLTFLVALICCNVWSYDFTVGGIYYNLDLKSNTVEVARSPEGAYTCYSGNIVIPSNVRFRGRTYVVKSIGARAFDNFHSVVSISIPNTVTIIRRDAIYACYNLVSVKMSDNIEIIERGNFWSCGKLKSIHIPNKLKSIEDKFCGDCSSLVSIDIPRSVTTIGKKAFEGCRSLRSVFIPKSVSYIGEGSFCGCKSLENIEIEQGNANYDSRENINAIIDLKSNKLIAGCKNTVIPNSVTCIGFNAFRNLTDLSSINIPSSVTIIEPYAFDNCKTLSVLNMSNSIVSIGYKAFRGCASLTEIVIPKTVTNLESSAFAKCIGLKSVTCFSEEPIDIDETVFSDIPNMSNITLRVPQSAINEYKSSQWQSFGRILPMK